MSLRYLNAYSRNSLLNKKRQKRKVKITHKGKTTTCSLHKAKPSCP